MDKRLGKYPPLFTDTEENNCFSIYHTSLIANSQIAILFPTKVGKNWVRMPFCFTRNRQWEVNST